MREDDMVQSAATTVTGYLESLPADRRKTIGALRKLIRANLPAGFKEMIGYGMICYSVPLKTYPATYNGQPLCYAALASQKNYCSLYLTGVYSDPVQRRALEAAFKNAGKKLDMGKSCIRFKTVDDLPLEAIGLLVGSVSLESFVATYEASRKTRR
jgi:hypothetical protein